MKLFHISLLLLLLHGCITEDMDACFEEKENNLRLEFVYADVPEADIFNAKIHGVEVFVFDNNGYFVQQQTVDKASLSVFCGTEMNLSPGTYSIVCWGNTSEKTSFSSLLDWREAFLSHSFFNSIDQANDGDPLFYAPKPSGDFSDQSFWVTIPEQGGQTAAIYFCDAHIRIEIYIKGFAGELLQREMLPPIVELTDIPTGYKFDMETLNDHMSYRDITFTQSIEEEEFDAAVFHTPFFDENTPIQILIKKQSDNTTVTTISLKDFIRDNNIEISKEGTVIPILVEYKQASVHISLPGWNHVPVEPGINKLKAGKYTPDRHP